MVEEVGAGLGRESRRTGAMTRGNQRELARAKNMKKNTDKGGKKAEDGLSAAARKERDAQIMQEKQKKALEKKDEPK